MYKKKLFLIKKNFIFSLILIFSMQSVAQKKNTFKFLSQEQFLNLTEPEKKSYLKEIRILLEEMTENSKVSIYQYLFFPNAVAQTQRAEFNTPSSNTVIELDRLDSLMRATRMYKKGAAENSAPTALQVSKENAIKFVQRMNQVSENLNTETDRRIYGKLKTEFAQDFPAESQQIKLATATVSTRSIQPSAVKPVEKSRPKEHVTQEVKSEKVKAETDSTAPYCIYAGFVIYGDKCSPNKKLPKDFVLSEIRTDMFKCESDSEILCNPLLFGFKKNCFKLEDKDVCSEKPLCIERSVNATKNCLKLSDSTEQLNQVLELWKNPKNKDVYEKFAKDLNKLCNEENIVSNDVKQTCQVAARRFNKIIETNYPTKMDLKIKTADPVKTNK
jgi:hypothetical protein